MTLEQAYFITQIIVGFGFIISIVFLAVQVRQNSFLLRTSMADQRNQKSNWFFETICTNNEFRAFQQRIGDDWGNFNEDDRYRAHNLAMRNLRPLLDELVAYYDGMITDDEWLRLQWNLKLQASRPNFAAAYELLKEGYPTKVREYWESLPKLTEDPVAELKG